MLNPINEASKRDLEIYVACTNSDPYNTCNWCDARDGCTRCDSEWCAPFAGDKD